MSQTNPEQSNTVDLRTRQLRAKQVRDGLEWLRTHGWDTIAVGDAIEDMRRCVDAMDAAVAEYIGSRS